MDLTKSYEFLKPEMCRDRIHIIGCGAIGSTVAENLARFGLTKITLYDFDTVEPHNVANQMFTNEDIGKPKVLAVAEYLKKINPEIVDDLKIADKGYTGQRLSGYVFLCVDNIDLRRVLERGPAMEQRVRAVEAFINSMAFSHEEAKEATPVSACNIPLSVCPTVRTVVAYGVANFVNFVKGLALKKMILVDAFSFQVDAF